MLRKERTESSIYDGEDCIVCDDCDSHYQWCNVCETHASDEPLCRHLYYDDNGELNGSGTYRSNWEKNKYPFFALLNLIGREAAIALKTSLENHKYYHQFRGSIFGFDSLDATWFVGDRVIHANPYFAPVFTCSDPYLQPVFNCDSEKTGIVQAVNWLVSLYSGCYGSSWWESDIVTPEQDLLTASWIGDWLVANDCTSLAKQDVFIISYGELMYYPAVHQSKGLKVVKFQWNNHFAVVHSSGFVLPYSRTFDRDKAISFCDICSHYPIVINPVYQMLGDRELSLLQRAERLAETVKTK
jgi:hypothetical protein